ncbi:MAG: 30S ribosome-binding factor RbfA [Bacillota bacterium]
MASHRNQRVAEQIKKELAQILREEIKDPRVGFITITSVEASGDLRHVKVFVSVLGDDDERASTMEVLTKASGFIRREIASRIALRYTPDFAFKFDSSIQHGARIHELLSRVKEEENQ